MWHPLEYLHAATLIASKRLEHQIGNRFFSMSVAERAGYEARALAMLPGEERSELRRLLGEAAVWADEEER